MRRNKTRDLTLISIFAALTAIGAFIRIPIPVVPFTLQYFFCALGAVLLGARRGAMAQIVYVFVGLVGFPIFTQGGGLGYVFQPTFGYLIGFIVAAYLIGKLTENLKEISIKNIFLASSAGLVVIYLLGTAYMYMIYNLYLGQTMSVYTAVMVGTIPFIPSDLLLTLIISIVGSKVAVRLKKLCYTT